ncbi:ecdysone-induced protein 78C-like isoform X2 [Paramacrobiotus metropolitanus]|uniref:ecdysone-induced protein 78C-like isoform X2 n=1 Tax=Paramacrobiotus metropolitanus TaxID=2943436 RepID=UPI0024459921|nr:ecdysone-induced protein 78C-like isoform X2 [Paramacrobiotus metropolitanus]
MTTDSSNSTLQFLRHTTWNRACIKFRCATFAMSQLTVPPVKCKICGGTSSGVHYGVVSCEGCKAFYKRCVEKKLSYQCYFGGKCSISARRGRCKSCRFKKCVEMGMSFQAVKMGRIPKHEKAAQLAALLQSVTDVEDSTSTSTSSGSPVEQPTVSAHNQQISNNTDPQRANNPGSIENADMSTATFPPVAAFSTRSSIDISEPIFDSIFDGLDVAEFQADVASSSMDVQAVDQIMPVQPQFPVFLDNYLAITEQRNANLRQTAMAVTDAVTLVYWDQIETWTAFMTNSIGAGENTNPPHELNLDGFPQLARAIYDDDQRRMIGFAKAIPGFADLSTPDQDALISEKFTLVWLFHHAPYTSAGEVFYLAGFEDFHYGRYWMDQTLDPNFIKAILAFMDALNELQLTLTESYVLMAIGMFRPDTTRAGNTSLLGALQAHYMDVLLYLIRSRMSPALLSRTLKYLKEILKKLPCIQGIATDYVNKIDLEQLPFRPSHGGDFASILRYVCKECTHGCTHKIPALANCCQKRWPGPVIQLS